MNGPTVVTLHHGKQQKASKLLFCNDIRESVANIVPHFLNIMGRHHEDDVRRYFLNAFGYDTSIEESSRKLAELFASFGVPMAYESEVSRGQVDAIPCQTELSKEEVFEIVCLLTSSPF